MKKKSGILFISCCIVAAAFFSAVYSSCNRDQCKSIVCANNGVCNRGECICPTGYGGTNCETVLRQKFLGKWTVFEKGSTTVQAQYPITIKEGQRITDVQIVNFNNQFKTNVIATVGGQNGDSLFITDQQVQDKFVLGVGYIATSTTYGQFGTISMRYEVIDSATDIINDYGYYLPDLSAASVWNK